MGKCSWLVSVVQMVPAWPSGSYQLEVMGFGTNPEVAEREIAEKLAFWNAQEYAVAPGVRATRPHRAIVRRACEACRITGVVPGFKRKVCGECAGAGTFPVTEVV